MSWSALGRGMSGTVRALTVYDDGGPALDQQLGQRQERLGEEQPLAHPEGERVHAVTGALAQTDGLEGALDRARRRERLAPQPEPREVREVLARRQRLEQRGRREGEARALHDELPPAEGLEPEDARLAGARPQEAGEDTQQSGLARSVGPDRADDLAGLDAELDARERDPRAETPPEAAYLHRNRRHARGRVAGERTPGWPT